MSTQTLGPVASRALAAGLSVEEYCRQQLFDRDRPIVDGNTPREFPSRCWGHPTSSGESKVTLKDYSYSPWPRRTIEPPTPKVLTYCRVYDPKKGGLWHPTQWVIKGDRRYLRNSDPLPDDIVFSVEDWTSSAQVRARGAKMHHAGVRLHVAGPVTELPADPIMVGGRPDWDRLMSLEGNWKPSTYGFQFMPLCWSMTNLGNMPSMKGTMRLFSMDEAKRLGLLCRLNYQLSKGGNSTRDTHSKSLKGGDVERRLYHFTFEVVGKTERGYPLTKINLTEEVKDSDFPVVLLLNPDRASVKDMETEGAVFLVQVRPATDKLTSEQATKKARRLETVRIKEYKPSYVQYLLEQNWTVGPRRQILTTWWENGEARALRDKERVLPLSTSWVEGCPEIDQRPLESNSSGTWANRPYFLVRPKVRLHRWKVTGHRTCQVCGGTWPRVELCATCEGKGFEPLRCTFQREAQQMDLSGTQHYVPTAAQGYVLSPWGSVPTHHGQWLQAAPGRRTKKAGLKETERQVRSGLVDIDDMMPTYGQTREWFQGGSTEGDLQKDEFRSKCQPWQDICDELNARRHVPLELKVSAIHKKLHERLGYEKIVQAPEKWTKDGKVGPFTDDLGRRCRGVEVWHCRQITKQMVLDEARKLAWFEGQQLIESGRALADRARRLTPSPDAEIGHTLDEMSDELILLERRVTPDLRRCLEKTWVHQVWVTSDQESDGEVETEYHKEKWKFRLKGTPMTDDLSDRWQDTEEAFRREDGEKAREGDYAVVEAGRGGTSHYRNLEVQPLLPKVLASLRMARIHITRAKARMKEAAIKARLVMWSELWEAFHPTVRSRPVQGLYEAILEALDTLVDTPKGTPSPKVITTRTTRSEDELDHDFTVGQGQRCNCKATPCIDAYLESWDQGPKYASAWWDCGAQIEVG